MNGAITYQRIAVWFLHTEGATDTENEADGARKAVSHGTTDLCVLTY